MKHQKKITYVLLWILACSIATITLFFMNAAGISDVSLNPRMYAMAYFGGLIITAIHYFGSEHSEGQ
jgi:arginine exporter protein ArgO